MTKNKKVEIIGTGLSGLVGSKFVDLYTDTYEFTNLDRATGIDITDEKQIKKIIEKSTANTIIHLAAFTDVNAAFAETGDKSGIAYAVNVLGTRNMAQAAKDFGKHLIHISTDFVFDGEKKGLYTEEDSVNPIEWYGQTKAWAEEEVEKSGAEYTILRIAFPYRQDDFPKMDVMHRIKKLLEEDKLQPMFIDHSFTPTQIEKLADTFNFVIKEKITGLYHASTDPVTTDYQFALKVKEQFGLAGEVRPGSLKEYLRTAKRPYQKNTALNVEKLKKVIV